MRRRTTLSATGAAGGFLGAKIALQAAETGIAVETWIHSHSNRISRLHYAPRAENLLRGNVGDFDPGQRMTVGGTTGPDKFLVLRDMTLLGYTRTAYSRPFVSVYERKERDHGPGRSTLHIYVRDTSPRLGAKGTSFIRRLWISRMGSDSTRIPSYPFPIMSTTTMGQGCRFEVTPPAPPDVGGHLNSRNRRNELDGNKSGLGLLALMVWLRACSRRGVSRQCREEDDSV